MDGLIARELPDMLTIVIVAFIILLFGIAYMRWAHGERGSQRQFEADLRESATILVILLALVLLPAALLLPLPAWVSRAWLAAGALTGWGMLVAAFWNERVVPVATLALPSGLPQPGVLPAALAPFWPVVPDEGETITGVSKRSFQWTYTPGDGRPVELALQLTLNNERYEAARSEPRRPVGDWAYYAERDMPELHASRRRSTGCTRTVIGRRWSRPATCSASLSAVSTIAMMRTPRRKWSGRVIRSRL